MLANTLLSTSNEVNLSNEYISYDEGKVTCTYVGALPSDEFWKDFSRELTKPQYQNCHTIQLIQSETIALDELQTIEIPQVLLFSLLLLPNLQKIITHKISNVKVEVPGEKTKIFTQIRSKEIQMGHKVGSDCSEPNTEIGETASAKTANIYGYIYIPKFIERTMHFGFKFQGLDFFFSAKEIPKKLKNSELIEIDSLYKAKLFIFFIERFIYTSEILVKLDFSNVPQHWLTQVLDILERISSRYSPISLALTVRNYSCNSLDPRLKKLTVLETPLDDINNFLISFLSIEELNLLNVEAPLSCHSGKERISLPNLKILHCQSRFLSLLNTPSLEKLYLKIDPHNISIFLDHLVSKQFPSSLRILELFIDGSFPNVQRLISQIISAAQASPLLELIFSDCPLTKKREFSEAIEYCMKERVLGENPFFVGGPYVILPGGITNIPDGEPVQKRLVISRNPNSLSDYFLKNLFYRNEAQLEDRVTIS